MNMLKLIIKALYFIGIITLLYFAFTYIKQYDFDLLLQFQEYKITINSIAFIVLSIAACLLVLLLINACYSVIVFLLTLLGLKKRSFYKEQVIDLLKIFKYITLNNKSRASKILSRMQNNIISEKIFIEYNIAVLFLKSDVSDQINSLSYLIKEQEFKKFAINKLAKTFFDLELYDRALEIIGPSADNELLEILCDIYAAKKEWDKFKHFSGKLLEVMNTTEIIEKISNYYLKATQCYLDNENYKEAITYLDACLAVDVSNTQAIDLYCSLNIKLARASNNTTILDNAFKNSPSFQIFELYTTNVDMDLHQIYHRLSNLVDIQHYRELFLSIAAYCNIPYSKYEKLIS